MNGIDEAGGVEFARRFVLLSLYHRFRTNSTPFLCAQFAGVVENSAPLWRFFLFIAGFLLFEDQQFFHYIADAVRMSWQIAGKSERAANQIEMLGRKRFDLFSTDRTKLWKKCGACHQA